MQNLIAKAKNLNNGQSTFLLRLAVFLLFYTLIFLFHPQFTRAFYGYEIQNYQPYLLYFVFPSLVIFAIFKWDEIKHFRAYKNSAIQTLIFGGLAVCIFMLSTRKWLAIYDDTIPHQFTYYFPMILGYIFMFLAIFNYRFSRWFSSELFLIAYIFPLFIALQVIVESYWLYLAGGLLYPLYYLLSPIAPITMDPSQLKFSMNHFTVQIGATCSGVYSVITFIFLFVAAGLLIHKNHKIDVKKAAIALGAGLLLVFALNIARIATIMLIGAYIDADLAINLFHEFLSALFLVGLFVAYLYLVFPRILKKG